MKKKIYLILFLSFVSINAQIDPNRGGELRIWFTNTPQNYNITLKVESISTYWDASLDYQEHYISHNYEDFDPVNLTQNDNDYYDIDLCWSPGLPITLGLGLYRIKIVYENDSSWFDIDYRTSALPECIDNPPQNCDQNLDPNGIDLEFDFNMATYKFEYNSADVTFTTQRIWLLKDFCCEDKTNLQPYPPENISVVNFGGHPKITWDHSSEPDDFWFGYKIYHNISPSSPPVGSFYMLDSLDAYSLFYVDTQVDVGNNWIATYYLTAVNGNMESDNSDMVSIEISAFRKNNDSNKESKLDYKLYQNYPNPFNPSTMISFSLKNNSLVILRVYDVLGKEVIRLLNKEMPAGIHQIEFDGSKLKSGVYYYEITADEFKSTKKLILLK